MTLCGLEETVLWSHWFHRRAVAAVQLAWPDTRGVFAWQPGAAPFAAALQPQVRREPTPRTGPLVHFAHVVHSVPSMWELHDLAIGEQAFRETAWSPWMRGALADPR